MSLPGKDGTMEDRARAAALHGDILSGEAKKALATYGDHLEWCATRRSWFNETCDCGLAALTGGSVHA